MALQLYFRGQQIGDNFLKMEVGDHLLTRPVKSVGLFQDTAAINADSRNRVHARSFFVVLKRAAAPLG